MFCLPFECAAECRRNLSNCKHCSELNKVSKHKLVTHLQLVNLQNAQCSHKNVILNEKNKWIDREKEEKGMFIDMNQAPTLPWDDEPDVFLACHKTTHMNRMSSHLLNDINLFACNSGEWHFYMH